MPSNTPGKIALEEHFAIEETLMDSAGFVPEDHWPELKSRILDIQDRRLRLMDQHGIERMILSLNAPAVQAILDPAKANDVARRANDVLASEIAKRPDRFSGFAALPMQDPDLAIRELQRCVSELGFKGPLVNGFSQGRDGTALLYYDLPQYWPFWQAVERLDVPFYLHPRNPLPADSRIYEGHAWLLGPTWAFAQETAVHALRLIGSGLFDAHPNLTVILGHMGEGLPFYLWRISHGFRAGGLLSSLGDKTFRDIFCEHFWITTSGFFSDPALLCCVMEMGIDRILFSVDYPFAENPPGTEWTKTLPLCAEDRKKLLSGNAKRLLKL